MVFAYRGAYMANHIDQLIKGYHQFHQNYFDGKNDLFQQLVEQGQKPKFLVIACADSRVDPALLLNAQPGDLFVIRNVANLVPPYGEDTTYSLNAALEFGLCGLGIKNIILLGHSSCGGIQALMSQQNNAPESSVEKWVAFAAPAREKVVEGHSKESTENQIELCCQYSLINSLKNLSTYPWVQEKVTAKKLTLHAWKFDLKSGQLNAFSYNEEAFKPL